MVISYLDIIALYVWGYIIQLVSRLKINDRPLEAKSWK